MATKVAVIDSNPDTVRSVSHVLTSRGHQVINNLTVSAGRQATQLITDTVSLLRLLLIGYSLPEIVLIDIGSPVGQELLQYLTRTKVGREMIIIALCHQDSRISAEELMQAYGAHYVPKPFNLRTLADYIDGQCLIGC